MAGKQDGAGESGAPGSVGLTDLEKSGLIADLERNVESRLVRRYSWIGGAFAILALFGGHTLIESRVDAKANDAAESVVGEVRSASEAELRHIRMEAAELVRRAREDADGILDRLRGEQDKLREARDEAEDSVAELIRVKDEAIVAAKEAQRATRRGNTFLAETRIKLREVNKSVEEIPSKIDEKIAVIEQRLAPLGSNLRGTQRTMFHELAVIRLVQERNDAITDFVNRLAAAKSTTPVPTTDSETNEMRKRLAHALESYDRRLEEVKENYDYNIVLYRPTEEEWVKSVQRRLEDDALIPERWLAAQEHRTRRSIAAEIASEFGLTSYDLTPHKGAIVFYDTPGGRRVAERVRRSLETLKPGVFKTLPMPDFSPNEKHLVAHGREYNRDQVILVTVLPDDEELRADDAKVGETKEARLTVK